MSTSEGYHDACGGYYDSCGGYHEYIEVFLYKSKAFINLLP